MTTHPNEKEGRTQCARLWKYLQKHGRITPLEAIRKLGIARLAARIHDLRKSRKINERRVAVRNAWGGTSRVSEYYLPRRGAKAGRA